MYTCPRPSRPSSEAIRSPSESIAADMADTRSSSTFVGRAEAIVKPSTLTTAEASISGVLRCISTNRATICSERDLGFALAAMENPFGQNNNVGDYTIRKMGVQLGTASPSNVEGRAIG